MVDNKTHTHHNTHPQYEIVLRVVGTAKPEVQKATAKIMFSISLVSCEDCCKPSKGPIRTGVGFLDHMVDQFNSHAQIGISLQVAASTSDKSSHPISSNEADFKSHSDYINRFAALDQGELHGLVGTTLGTEFRRLLEHAYPTNGSSSYVSHFGCPLDEALVMCTLEYDPNASEGELQSYSLAPYGKFPASGRRCLGKMQTQSLESAFWTSVAKRSGLKIKLEKISGDNAHHIVESSFKAFSRALRNLLDGVDTTLQTTSTINNNKPEDASPNKSAKLDSLYGPKSANWAASIALKRSGSVSRKTKETSIEAEIQMDGGASGVSVSTGIPIVDAFYTTMLKAACMSAKIQCAGDLWIDDHHTSEDVSIAVGQVIAQALGTKAGLNRMWSASSSPVSVVMDLSNRPMLTGHGLHAVLVNSNVEVCDGLALEMWEHVLDSLVVQARMTCHIVVAPPDVSVKGEEGLRQTMQSLAQAFGEALMYCAAVDQRRAGSTASSKGTLSV